MSLSTVTFIAALALLALGGALLGKGVAAAQAARGWGRSAGAAYVFFGAGALWFLWGVAHLGPEDFGEYKAPLLALFGGVAVGAFFVARDFLAIRGVAILLLLAARPALDAGANDPHPRRVFLNALIYGLIVLALWLGAAPFYWRDFWEWAMEKPARPRALGGALVAYGLLLAFVATTYGS